MYIFKKEIPLRELDCKAFLERETTRKHYSSFHSVSDTLRPAAYKKVRVTIAFSIDTAPESTTPFIEYLTSPPMGCTLKLRLSRTNIGPRTRKGTEIHKV